MSQSGSFYRNTGPGGHVESLTGDVGLAVFPNLGNIGIVGGSNILTTGDPGTSTVTIDLDSSITIEELNIASIPAGYTNTQFTTKQSALQTVGAAATTLISVPVAVGKMVTIKAYINGFKSTKDNCIGAEVFATFYRSPAGNITQAGQEVVNIISSSFADVDAVADVATQSAVIRVTGVNLETWNWVASYSYMYLISNL